MSSDILQDAGDLQMKRSDSDMDAEFDQHNVDVEEVLARTQRSFSSRSRRIQLYEAPEFIKRLNAFEEVCVGDTVVFSCQWRALPRPTVKWYKDDEEITEDPRYELECDEETPSKMSLVMKNARKEDEGAYKCKAENQEGVASTTGYLSVSGGSDNEDKTLASKQIRKVQTESPQHTVSSAPHLRTIVEQQSVEEREAESLRDQPPSPIQDFIDSMQTGRGRGATWPLMSMGYTNGGKYKDDDAESTGSDTSVESQDYERVNFNLEHEDDVFADEIPSRERYLLNGTPSDVSSNDGTKTHEISNAQNGSVIQNGVTSNRSTPEIKITAVKERMRTGKTKNTEHRRKRSRPAKMPSLDIEQLFGILDTPWIYFFPIVSSMTFLSAAVQLNPLVLVILMVLISFAVFRFVFNQDKT